LAHLLTDFEQNFNREIKKIFSTPFALVSKSF
jgi:hypothetical protein